MTNKELKEFEDDLLQSVREMKAKQFAGIHQMNVTEIAKLHPTVLRDLASN